MNQLTVIVGCYAIGAWAGAGYVTLRWLQNQTVAIGTFLTVTGWAAVLVLLAAIGATL